MPSLYVMPNSYFGDKKFKCDDFCLNSRGRQTTHAIRERYGAMLKGHATGPCYGVHTMGACNEGLLRSLAMNAS
jgi:hypothetical protein